MRSLGLCLRVTCVLLLSVAPAARAQGVTKEEERLARETAAAFSERLLTTRDFGPVVQELYARDFMRRHLARVSEREKALKDSPLTKQMRGNTFMLYGVPALEFRKELLARDDDENWPRLYAAVSGLMFYTYLSLMSRGSLQDLSDPEKMRDRDILSVYPPEAVRALEKNRTTASFLKRKGGGSEVATADDLRAAAEAFEEAARLTRVRVDKLMAERGPHLSKNLEVLKTASARAPVELVAEGGASPVLYPPGTRVFKVFSPLLYDLYLVSEGGRMKVAWANLPTD